MNGRLDTLQAAILLAKLEVFPEELEHRRRVASWYDERLESYVSLPRVPAQANSAWANYTIQLENRYGVAAALGAAGISTAIHYPVPVHLLGAYQHFGQGRGSLPISETLSKRVLSLPMHPYLEEATIAYICETLLAALQ